MTETRRASVIVAVLLLLAIGVVIAAGVLVSADAAAGATRAAMERTQARALAWSGVQAVMTELSRDRLAIIEGEEPQVAGEWELYSDESGVRGVVHLIDLTPEGTGPLAPEGGKLDINSATAEMLALVPGLSPELAGRVVEARAEGSFSSVEQLLSIEGIDPDLLYGRGGDGTEMYAPAIDPGPLATGQQAPGLGAGLRDFLTVFAFDPNVQTGLDGESDARGSMRVDLGQPWTDELADALADRVGEQAAQTFGSLIESRGAPESRGDLVQAMIDAGMPPEEWGLLLDIFTTSAEPFLSGLVDINHAPPEVLACLPGITPELGGSIASARETLDPGMRRSVAWPVVEGILTAEQFVGVVDHITTRSTQWRVRLEAGMERAPADEFGRALGPGGIGGDAGEGSEGDAGDLEHRMVFEAVIDIASARPRVAYLRDVTALGPVLASIRREEVDPLDALGPEPLPEDDGIDPAPDAGDDPFLEGAADLELGPAIEAEPPTDAAPEDAEEISPAPASSSTNAEQDGGLDRRIGRWSTRRATDR